MSIVKITQKNIDIFDVKKKYKLYEIEGKEITGEVSNYAVEPLRILSHVLFLNNIEHQVLVKNCDPWDIDEIRFDDKNVEFVISSLKEIMEYRCAVSLSSGFKAIIRQLPYNVAMKTSDTIMNFGKSNDDHMKDVDRSEAIWKAYGRNYGMNYQGNPNDTVDNISIPREEEGKRKHLIYKSARGGYNIKTLGYNDSSLDHYCFTDTQMWD